MSDSERIEAAAEKVGDEEWLRPKCTCGNDCHEVATQVRIDRIHELEAAADGVHPDTARHRQVAVPNWSTRTQCACGFESVSRCEWALHVVRELGLILAAGETN